VRTSAKAIAACAVETASLNHLAGARQQRWRNGETERPGGLEIDHKLDLHPPLDGEFGWLFTL